MAKCSLFTLQLLFGLFWLSHLQVTFTDHASVHPGENITLLCNITDYPEISWYQLRSDEVKLLISAEQGRVKKKYLLSYNVNKSHYDVTESNSSVSLVIIGVRETDLGFYYCGGRNDDKHIQFGKPIRLNFNITDDQETHSTLNSCEPSGAGVELRITASVCVASLLMNFICLCVFCYRLKGKSASCSCFSKTTNAKDKDESMHYASIQHGRRSRAAAKKSTGTESDSVLYAAVASQPRRH
ncbi:uncharacterized protein LOC124392623 [Silurus meridionalis]|uniref:Immunoglobulin domain-containing protein n=1 Tax=Silurus meridionalis TaxID=175797 RepID=A0A8T0B810_SILME|nr:uncharacterized protein LOC124392623 [Silurus meridionalis]XP_046715726.1 uncharacterized protein LOC124392623 [Silurus meridionalis]KAF7702513.1 hypothetical protein HF521_001796 [Silurus meridionalis]